MSERSFSILWLAVVGLLAVAFVAALVWGIWKTIHTPRFDPQAFAQQQGLLFRQEQHRDWVISAPDAAWQLAFRDDYSVDPQHDLGSEWVWTAALDFAPAQAIFVSQQPPQWLQGDAVFQLAQQLAQRLGRNEVSALAAQCQRVTLGDMSFDAAFAVAATDARLAAQHLNATARRSIEQFVRQTARHPRIIWSPGKLSIYLTRKTEEAVPVQALITLGSSLLANSREPF